jgi:hypothetical protein
MQRFLFAVGSVCRLKQFTPEVEKRGKRFADDEEVQTEIRKWLRQQSKDLYAAGFDALVKRWDKCFNAGGGYVEKFVFFFRFEYHMFYALYPFVTSLLTLSRTFLKMEAVCSSEAAGIILLVKTASYPIL